MPSARVSLPLAYTEWILLAVAGGALAWSVNVPFFRSAARLWVMGVLYRVIEVQHSSMRPLWQLNNGCQ